MLFSVIIPTCNRNDLLANCLSLLAPQEIVGGINYQVIISDDSKENLAADMVRERFPWAQWVAGPKRGPAANRNNGAKHAQGQWLVFLDDDCLPNRDILVNYSLLLTQNPGIKVFEGCIERQGKMMSPIYRAPGNSNTKGGYLLSCNFAILKSFFDELSGFDENFKYPHMEDYDLKDRILAKNETILFVLEAKVVHPWRKLKNGWKLGKFEEMSVYYNAKNGIPSSLITLLKTIAGSHLRIIKWFVKRFIWSADILIAIKVMLQHLLVVVLNFYKWNKIHSSKSINCK